MAGNIEQLFHDALSNQNAGNLPQAEMLYHQVLACDPNNPDALHQLGLTNQYMGKSATAIDFFRRAVALRPNADRFWTDLIVALLITAQIPQAIAAAQEAASCNPNSSQAHIDLGNALLKGPKPREAINSFRRAIELQPDHADAHFHLGSALQEAKQWQDAIDAYQKTIRLAPFYPEACNNLGLMLHKAGRVEEAIAAYQLALDQVERSRQRTDGRWRVARQYCYPQACDNLWQLLNQLGRYDQAIEFYSRSVAIWPSDPDCQNGLGMALSAAGRHTEAIRSYERAIALLPNCADFHWNLALLLLTIGDFARGWEELEWRLLLTRMNLARTFEHPKWDNQPLSGKTILLHTEGGFGDALQFIRYAPMVAQRAGKVIVECQPELASLFETCKQSLGISQIVRRGDALPHFDYFSSLLSLPRAFGTNMETIPAVVPYLHAAPEKIARWKERLADDHAFKVGLAWSGNNTLNDSRSCTLDIFAPLANVKGVSFYNLQKGPNANQPVPPGMNLLNPADPNADFADTAALMANLDLIISVDSSPAHLAGAIGRPTWVLLSVLRDFNFRWLLNRTDSPWYPTVRLFRQKRSNDWSHVVRQIAEELHKTVKS